jgi:hypothetical protein
MQPHPTLQPSALVVEVRRLAGTNIVTDRVIVLVGNSKDGILHIRNLVCKDALQQLASALQERLPVPTATCQGKNNEDSREIHLLSKQTKGVRKTVAAFIKAVDLQAKLQLICQEAMGTGEHMMIADQPGCTMVLDAIPRPLGTPGVSQPFHRDGDTPHFTIFIPLDNVTLDNG